MIRSYVAHDWSEICRVYDASKPIELSAGGVAESFRPLVEDPDRMKDFAASTVLVWEEKEAIRGFIGFRDGFIGWLFVDPSAFRRGIARNLLSRAMGMLVGEVSLWTMEGNQPAIRLYESLGFRIAERRDSANRGFPCVALKMKKKTA